MLTRQPGPHGAGENLRGASKHPVKLSDPSKLVYSPHSYGPAIYDGMKYFNDGAFPRNMPRVWDDHYGSRGGAVPIVIGETGGSYQGARAGSHTHARAVMDRRPVPRPPTVGAAAFSAALLVATLARSTLAPRLSGPLAVVHGTVRAHTQARTSSGRTQLIYRSSNRRQQ